MDNPMRTLETATLPYVARVPTNSTCGAASEYAFLRPERLESQPVLADRGQTLLPGATTSRYLFAKEKCLAPRSTQRKLL